MQSKGLSRVFSNRRRRQVASVVSDSVRPHGLQPTRLFRPWDSPGKNTGVGCHFLLQCMKVESESEVTQSWLTLRDPMDCTLPGSSIDLPGKSTGVGCQCLLPSSPTPQFKSINSSALSLLHSPTLTSMIVCVLGHV